MREFKGKNRILVVDNKITNIQILSEILSQDYFVIKAENGYEAFDILENNPRQSFSAIILDLKIPDMDGYEFLQKINKTDRYKCLPVIVTTGGNDYESEKKALQSGAWDFVLKPYDLDILKFRLKNVIERSQLHALKKLRYIAEYDQLTDIYNKSKFIQTTREMIDKYPETEFAVIRFDINRFKLINSFFGICEGDKLLIYIAAKLREFCIEREKCTFGRIGGDVFALCISYNGADGIYRNIQVANEEIRRYKSEFDIVPSFGIYIVKDRALSVESMLGRANIAVKRIKGGYIVNHAFYIDEMGKAVEKEQEIVNGMNNALNQGQFKIYLQPKFELKTKKYYGAEALVRWEHPVKGVVSPGEFIPVFEHNGFISKLDRYVWESVCILIRKWMDMHRMVNPMSVNVSRVNMYDPNLCDDLCRLVEKYGIPKKFLRLEITESIFTENNELLYSMVSKLRKCGFIVIMDDFGSGYSSLNVLKDIDVDYLKIDMKFLSDTDNSQKGLDIISSVVMMAKKINISTLAEGVEKESQADFLAQIGCDYAQGYYYAEPMPVEKFEEMMNI